jgi:hypothetical protein
MMPATLFAASRFRGFVLGLMLAVVLCGLPVGAAEDITIMADRLVSALEKNDFAAPRERFDDNLKNLLTADKLQAAWMSLQGQMGKMKLRSVDRLQKIQGFDVVFVKCRFEKGEIETKVVFDADKRVTGLFFVPAGASATAPPPAYAQADRFAEKAVEIGTGSWKLPGVLTLPVGSGTFPAVVLVHGSGPGDRDETVGGCKPFRDIAHGLSSKGIAVLRYDKRTRVHMAKILQKPVGFTVKEESILDVLEAVSFLHSHKNIDSRRITIVGHSLGGMLVPRLAAAEPRAAAFVILAGATRPLEDHILEQITYIASLQASPTPELKKSLTDTAREVERIKALTPADATATAPWILGALPGYWLDLRGYAPAPAAKKITKPLLILQGERDYQVTMKDFANWKTALAARKDVKFISYPLLNHLFIAGDGKSTPDEYQTRANVAASVIDDLAEFIFRK